MEDREFYANNGYIILKGLLPKELCVMLLEEMRFWATKEYGSIMNPDRLEYFIPQCFTNSKKYLTDNVDDFERAREASWMMRRAMFYPQLMKKLDQIIDDTVVAIGSHYFFKESGSLYAKQSWSPHQDNEWTKNKNNNLLLAHITLEKSRVENGCVYLYAGSHKEPLLPVIEEEALLTNSMKPGRTVKVPDIYLDKKVDCILDAGDVVVCHGNTIHGSYPNVSSYGRPTYAVHYIPEGEEFISGDRARRNIIRR